MTSVKVNTADLRQYVGLLNRNAEHNDKVLAYMRQWCGADMQAVNAEGLLAKALDFHDRIYNDAVNLVTELGKAVRGSAAELEKAAKLYDSSDTAAKERFEHQYVPPGNGLPARESWEATHSGYADYMNPLDLLVGTPGYQEFKDPTKFLDKLSDATSLSGLVLSYLEQAFGFNPVEKLVLYLSGNWEAYSKAAGAWGTIGEALERIGKNIDRGLASLDHAWDGTASESAYVAFQELADLFKGMLARFREIEKVYKDFARFAMYVASVLVDTVKLAIDTVIYIIAKRKAPLFGEAQAAFQAVKLAKYVGYFGYTMLTARGMIATMFLGASSISSEALRGVRAAAYDASGI